MGIGSLLPSCESWGLNFGFVGKLLHPANHLTGPVFPHVSLPVQHLEQCASLLPGL